MPYTPWPKDGCTLAEARERTADREAWKVWHGRIEGYEALGPQRSYLDGDSLADVHDHDRMRSRLKTAIGECEERISSEFRRHLETKQLIAYGRPGDLGAAPQLISSDIWPALTAIGWNESAAEEARQGGSVFRAIRIFPALLAPCRVESLTGRPLSEAFKKFVLADPEVSALGKIAVKVAPQFERVFVRGCRYVHGVDEWPLASEQVDGIGVTDSNAERRSPVGFLAEPDPPAVLDAADALHARYRALLALLRGGELEGQAVPVVPGYSDRILCSIWSHPDFHFDARTGDLLEVNPECEDPPRDWLVKRWTGVVLQRPKGSERPIELSTAIDNRRLPVTRYISGKQDGTSATLFTPHDVVQAGSLAAALEGFVVNHPEIRSLRNRAREVAETERIVFDDDAGLIGIVMGHDEPLLPLRYVRNEHVDIEARIQACELEEDSVYAKYFNRPPELEAFYDALNQRTYTLFGFLQRASVVGFGHTVVGDLVRIAHTIWAHESFYVHPPTGDVYEACADTMTRRWTGVILQSPAGVFHVQPTEPDGLRSVTTVALPLGFRSQSPPEAASDVGSNLKQRPARQRPKTAAVEAALRQVGIDIESSSLGLKEIAGRIAHLLPNPPQTESALVALTKCVERIRRETRKS